MVAVEPVTLYESGHQRYFEIRPFEMRGIRDVPQVFLGCPAFDLEDRFLALWL
jgi:hypothetical protein